MSLEGWSSVSRKHLFPLCLFLLQFLLLFLQLLEGLLLLLNQAVHINATLQNNVALCPQLPQHQAAPGRQETQEAL